ncbi:MAG: hypothetical protein V1685_07380 [Parcubacteria group bacterium]
MSHKFTLNAPVSANVVREPASRRDRAEKREYHLDGHPLPRLDHHDVTAFHLGGVAGKHLCKPLEPRIHTWTLLSAEYSVDTGQLLIFAINVS